MALSVARSVERLAMPASKTGNSGWQTAEEG
jgi:hypothetical protein